MNWEAVGAIAELAGALGVIASLVYLATQIRQNTRALRSSAVQDYTMGTANAIGLMGQSPENAAVFQRGLQLFDDLSEPERAHFSMMIASVYLNCDAMYWINLQGIVPSELWDREQRLLQFYLSMPGGRRVWERLENVSVSQPFAEYVRTRLLPPDSPAV